MTFSGKKTSSDYLDNLMARTGTPTTTPLVSDYFQTMYLEKMDTFVDTTKNLIAAANVGMFSLTFVAMFVTGAAKFASKISDKITKFMASDIFYCAILYITAMMSKIAPTYGKYISSGLLTLFGLVMVRKSNGFKMLRPAEAANYWYLGSAAFAFLYAYKQISELEKRDTLSGSLLSMSSNFNSVAVLLLLFLGSKNYGGGGIGGNGRGRRGISYGGSTFEENNNAF